MVVATYRLDIDLNNDAGYGDAGENVTADVNAPGGGAGVLLVADRGADAGTPLAPPKAGALDAQLANDAGTYSPGGNLQGGRLTRLQATYSAVTYDLWAGRVQRAKQVPASMRKAVDLSAFGVLASLVGKQISTALYANVTTDVALGHLLDAAGLTGPARDFDTGRTTLEWYWEPDETDAFEALLSLVYTEGPGASLYEDGAGGLVFRHRTARVTEVRSATSQVTFNGTGAAHPLISHPFDYDDGLDRVFNAATLTVKKRSAAALAVAWTLGEAITLSAGESRTYVATAANNDPMTAAVTPASPTDYALSSGSLASVTLDRTSGPSIAITLTAGAGGAAMPDLQLRAQVVGVDNTYSVTNQIDASASIAAHGRIPWASGRLRAEISRGAAQSAADAIVAWYQDGRPQATVSVKANRHADAMLACLTSEIGDRVTVTEGLSGVDSDFYIERIQHQITAPLSHLTTFTLSAALTGNYAIWDESEWDGGEFWAW